MSCVSPNFESAIAVTIEPMKLLYVEVANDIAVIKNAWSLFEAQFPSLSGRKFLGLEYQDVFWCCSVVRAVDNNDSFGLEQFFFGGGSYIRLRIKDEPPQLYDKIAPAYKFLFNQYGAVVDSCRPLLEYYKARNVLDVMVPVVR